MPITLARIDDRRYDDLVAEALGRASVHTPEWTNLTRSDPGVTLIEVFAFLTETLLYRANQIPERNRKKFLQLLRIPLRTASAARGLIAIRNEAPSPNPLPIILPAGVEVRAGEVPFRTTRALDVLPVEARFYVKRRIVNPAPEVKQYYQQLYASYRGPAPEVQPDLYEAVPFPSRDGASVALSSAIDNAVWLALLMRPSDTALTVDNVRKRIANRTLSLGVVPSLAESRADLPAGRAFGAEATVTLKVDAPKVPDSGGLPAEPSQRIAEYQAVAVKSDGDVFSVPGVIDVSLPGESALRLWNNIDPLEAGVGGLPPAIDDESVAARVVTWLRITASAPVTTQFLWMGINAVPISQRAAVIAELLPDGTGEPDQAARLSQAPVLPETVRITVTPETGGPSEWQEVDDLSAAAPEVRVIDPRESPGRRLSKPAATDPSAAQRDPSHVFALNAESGEVRFGDGARGARPPERATIRASYEYARGAAGNVSAGRINAAPSLPEGFKVSNPVETWGGADAESVAEGEKQIARYLQHRDRLVTAEDFRTIALRTPGVSIGRIEVLPAYHPDFGGAEVPGVVTLMLVPSYDPLQPDAPLPRKPFLDAICRYLDPRRLVTTEVVLRGPEYVGIWISIGVKVAAGFNESAVREAVERDIRAFLAPTAGGQQMLPEDPSVLLGGNTTSAGGWKLGKAVVALELAAVANRTRGIEFVQEDVLLAGATGSAVPRVDMVSLQLPRILGISVVNGAPMPLDALRGSPSGGVTQTPAVVQIPAIPEECR
ncbi:MAG TPA: baseplate J/gp47 family protein [Vicinamibacterales bacterium]|nr:baseplate J/gp47 family protein [Vicinamibacterales bacterium]